MTRPPQLPLTFDQELAPHLFKALLGGWSCALVGFAGCGLSNLLRFAAEPRLAQHYLQAEPANTLVGLVDADRLLEPAQLFPVLARQVLLSARAQGRPRAEQAALRRLAQHPAPPARRPPGRARGATGGHTRPPMRRPQAARVLYLRRVRRGPAWIACGQPARAARRPPVLIGFPGRPAARAGLAADRLAGEPGVGTAKFAELFEQHTCPLRPCSRDDAGLAIARKTVGWAEAPSPEQPDNLYRLTGGHAKLLIASPVYLESRRHSPWANVERSLLGDPRLAEICRAI